MARLDATGDAVPMTYMGSNGKQYVVIGAGGSNRFRMIANTADQIGDGLTAFALPDTQTTQARPRTESETRPRAPQLEARVRATPEELKSPGPPLPDGEGKEVVARMCTQCHGTTVFSKMRMSRIGWEDEVVSMIEKGAKGTEGEIRIVVDYMVKYFGKESTKK